MSSDFSNLLIFFKIRYVSNLVILFLFRTLNRSSRRRCSVRKAANKDFTIFTGKLLCWSLFLIKLQALRLTALLKRKFNTGVFLWILWNFQKLFKSFCQRQLLVKSLRNGKDIIMHLHFLKAQREIWKNFCVINSK